MRKSILFIGLIIGGLLSWSVSAQEKKKSVSKVKSYKDYKASSIDDAALLLEEAHSLKDKNPGEALNKVQDALGISIATKDVFNEGRCYVLIGEINESIQEWKLARDNYTTAYDRLKSQFTATGEYLQTLKGLGNTNLKLG